MIDRADLLEKQLMQKLRIKCQIEFDASWCSMPDEFKSAPYPNRLHSAWAMTAHCVPRQEDEYEDIHLWLIMFEMAHQCAHGIHPGTMKQFQEDLVTQFPVTIE